MRRIFTAVVVVVAIVLSFTGLSQARAHGGGHGVAHPGPARSPGGHVGRSSAVAARPGFEAQRGVAAQRGF